MFMIVVLAMSIVLAFAMILTAFAFGEVAFSEPGAVVRATARGHNHRSVEPHCPSYSNHPIRVSTPETLAITELVRKAQPPSEVERILQLSKSNMQRMQGLTQDRYARERIVCPLLGREGNCVAFDARPLHCRGCESAEHASEQCLMNQTEMEHGISQGLRCAGLDGNLYELNKALSIALESRDAASRWAKGENVLAG